MDATLKSKWVAALRSGNYKQAQGVLYRPSEGYCCLGLLCEVAGAQYEKHRSDWWPVIDGERADRGNGDEYLSESRFAIEAEVQERLAKMNDDGRSFDEIADYIEKHL